MIIQWLGDISLNGPYCDPQHASALKENLRSVAAGLAPCDLRIANWESPLWGDGRVNEKKVPRLATLPHAAKAIESLKLDVVLLANNHVYDCLEAGFDNTVRLLREMDIAVLGAGRTQIEAMEPLILERNGVRIGLLNYVGYDTHPNLPANTSVFLNWFDEDRARQEISELRKHADVVLVHLHWGDEFIRIPASAQRCAARRLAEAGATVVVGCHAHVLQGHERWAGGYIFHGMGNFLFWPPQAPLEASGPWPPYVREVGVACCRIKNGEVESAWLRHLIQDGLALRWDHNSKRKRKEQQLCRSLRLSERSFAIARRIEAFKALHILFRYHSIRQTGGFGPWMASRLRRLIRMMKPTTHVDDSPGGKV